MLKIDWYVRMPIDSPLADPIFETHPELCEEEDAILEQTFPEMDNQLLDRDG